MDEDEAVTNLVTAIAEGEDRERGKAWQSADKVGPQAIGPLAEVWAKADDFEVARSAKRAIWVIVRNVGRPGADAEKATAIKALLPLLSGERPRMVKAEVLWMLSELAGDEAVGPIAALLKDAELREDARCALQRLPGEKSLGALQAGLAAEGDVAFKTAIASSLRARGVEVPGLPCQKLVPAKEKTKTI